MKPKLRPQLESLVVCIPSFQLRLDSLEHAQETLRLVKDVTDEIRRARTKCESITQIEGHPATVVGLTIAGSTSVESIGMTYISGNEISVRSYSKQKFYGL